MNCALYCSVDASGLLIPLLVTGFPSGSHAILCSRWQCIARSSARQLLPQWFAHRIAQRMAADCSYLRLSTAFLMVCTLYCSADGSGLLILPLVNGFLDSLHTELIHG